jgi:hypothetical protein
VKTSILRVLTVVGTVVTLIVVSYAAWTPGARVEDGRHDRGKNGLWLQHGWLGDDPWFDRYHRDRSRFRTDEALDGLARLLTDHGIAFVFPHLCPCDQEGNLPGVDHEQVERFLDHVGPVQVLPWIGGTTGGHALLARPEWRKAFSASARRLLKRHPRLAGIHLNLEPLPSGDPDFLALLDELKVTLPTGKRLSIAAYPPPSLLHPFSDVHWDEGYLKRVAKRADQMAFMMYDTALQAPKVYEWLMRTWTGEILAWTSATEVLLGVPAYDDAGVGYHNPHVENIEHALAGIQAGLSDAAPLPPHFAGVALYSDWEMDATEWALFRARFLNPTTSR